jgi:hypothetical protein
MLRWVAGGRADADVMKARMMMTEAERKAQIVALWQGRPRDRRGREDVLPFYQWLLDYAPWLVPAGAPSLDQVRAVVEVHLVDPATVSPAGKDRRQRSTRRG